MHLRISKELQGVFLKFGKRMKGLVKFLVDYKVVAFSVLYIFLDAILISVLRNRVFNFTIGFVALSLCLLSLYLLRRISRKRNAVVSSRQKGRASPQKWIGTLFELLFFVLIVIFFVYIRSLPILVNEMEMGEKAVSFTSSTTSFVAFLKEEPTEKHRDQQLVVELLEGIEMGGQTLGLSDTYIQVKTSSFYRFQIGQVCNFRGTLEVPENFDGFDYRRHLASKKIFLLMDNPVVECQPTSEIRKGNFIQNWLVDAKNSLIAIIDEVLNEPQSSLLAGIIFGQKRLFSNDFDEGTRIAGLSHIVAASGYNVTILVIATERLFFFLPKKLRVISSLIVIWLFAILSGLSSSIVRACIMGSISLLAIIFGRSNAVHVAIPLASAIFVIINPLIVFDVGFLLSISAVLGLTYILPILLDLKAKLTKNLQFIDNNIFPTLSCTIVTMPISVLTFQTLSLWSVPSNTIILPIIDTTMFLGILGIALWNIFRPFSYIFFTMANMQLKYFELVVNLIHSLNWGQFEFAESTSNLVSLVFLVVVIILVIYLYPIQNEKYNHYLK